MKPKKLANMHWEEQRGHVDHFIDYIEDGLSCYDKLCSNCPLSAVDLDIKDCGGYYAEEYVAELKRLKEYKMIKQGDLVEKYDGNDWDDNGGKGYKYGLNDRDFYNKGGIFRFLVFSDDNYRWCSNVRPLNTKKIKALERIENAEKELAEAKKELENE